MIKAAVLGSPISHSLSPKIHNRAYDLLGLKSEYTAIEVDEKSFPDFFGKLESSEERSDWSGFSLTMPLKEIVLQYCNSADPIAKRISSGNTLFRSKGSWQVTSTDYLAFHNLLKVSMDSKVAIIGGGGTARAAIGSLNSRVAEVDVLLRSESRMPGLIKAAPDIKINSINMAHDLNEYDLIIQTTPAGIFDEYVSNTIRAKGTLLEALYKPSPTNLARHYKELGGEVITGKELLVEQALFQIELFTGQNFDFTEMRSALLSVIASD
jgi:shikimate dehydrogenase